MDGYLNNFVTVRQTRGDVLNPKQFRSVVEAIQAILDKYDFTDLSANYKKLLRHITDFNDPHHVRDTSFFNKIIEDIYIFYSHMTSSPLSLPDFKTQLSQDLNLIELFRRILLNRYIYDQIKNQDGSVPSSATVHLSDDYGFNLPSAMTLTFPPNIRNEWDFIEQGWKDNSSPYPVIQNATTLGAVSKKLPIIFESTSHASYFTNNNEALLPFPVMTASNDLTLTCQIKGNPTSATSIITFNCVSQTLSLVYTPDKKIRVVLNNQIIYETINGTDGHIQLTLDNKGRIVLATSVMGKIKLAPIQSDFGQSSIVTTATLGIPFHNLFNSSFGLLSVVIYSGSNDLIIIDDPSTFLIDPDSVFLQDNDNFFLIDSN